MTTLSKLTAAAICVAGIACAQSPAATETLAVTGGSISVKYNAPKVNGRQGRLFGADGRIANDPNYPVWRAGANSATKFHTDVDLTIAGTTIPKGDYSIYVNIANPTWVLILNKQTGQWGLSYDASKDAVHAEMKMTKPAAMIENLKYTLTDLGGGKVQLTLGWENFSGSVVMNVK